MSTIRLVSGTFGRDAQNTIATISLFYPEFQYDHHVSVEKCSDRKNRLLAKANRDWYSQEEALADEKITCIDQT